jgi:hypothetical protein
MHEPLPTRRTNAQERFDDFFNRALDAQERAEMLAGVSVRRRFRLASIDVEFRLAHPTLESLFCDALAHIEIAAIGEPDFSFHIKTYWLTAKSRHLSMQSAIFTSTSIAQWCRPRIGVCEARSCGLGRLRTWRSPSGRRLCPFY